MYSEEHTNGSYGTKGLRDEVKRVVTLTYVSADARDYSQSYCFNERLDSRFRR